MNIAYMKAEQEFDQKKREAYRILRVRIVVHSPAAVIILSAF
jgi:hypothetical protein